MKRVLISVPTMGWIHKMVAAKLLELSNHSKEKMYFSVTFPTEVPYENNLHHIILDFLKGDFDFWLNIDADNPPDCNPLDLMELDLDIIGLPTPMFQWDGMPGVRPIYWSAYTRMEDGSYMEHRKKEGLQEVDAVGSGCMLVHRRVFAAPFMRKGPFRRLLHEDGTVKTGPDIAFCERAKKAGFKIYSHFNYLCKHFKKCELNEMAEALLYASEKKPKKS